MTRPSRAQQRRRQRQRQGQNLQAEAPTRAGSRGSAAPGPPGRRPTSAASRRLDPVAEYRRALGYGKLMRSGLAAALGLLCAEEVLLATGRTPPGLVGSLAVGLILAFYIASLIAYFRVVYRVRREDPASWRPGPAMMGRMLGVPLGLGDPDAGVADRVLLGLTGLLAVSLLALSFVHKP